LLWLAAGLAAAALLWLLLALALLLAGRRADAREVIAFVPDCVVLGRRLLGDRRVPRRTKLALALLVAYLAVPLDLVPDFVPVVGQLDDALLVALVIAYVARRSGRELVTELWPGSERGLRIVLSFAN
jgi:uncharacterized membrane protein YkvA (DUF1232 family)